MKHIFSFGRIPKMTIRTALRMAALTAAFALVLEPLSNPALVNAANGHDDPGTQITNNATATYKDASSNTYSTTSNTVTTTVQNAPTMTTTPAAGSSYSPGASIIDTYTLANNGNAAGNFKLDTAGSGGANGAAFGGGDSASATLGGGPTSTAGCGSGASQFAITIGATTTYCDNVTDLNTFLALAGNKVTAGTTAALNVYYSVSNAAATGQTLTTTISPNLTYAAVGSAPAETTADVNGTETNNIVADARLDIYKASAQAPITGDITYTISAHNGGAKDAKDLQSVKALLGAAVNGIFVSDRVPQFGGSPLALSNSGTVTVTPNATFGHPTGAVDDTYYTTDTTGQTGWTKASGNLPTNGTVAYIGVFIHGGTGCTSGAGFDMCADVTHPTNPGNVNVASAAAIQFSFVIKQPTGSGSANAGSVKNLANGVVGDNQATEHILGPGIPTTADGPSSTPLTTAGQGINNTTLTSVGGASNQTSNQALSAFNALNGPLANPGSLGSFDGDLVNNPQNSSNDFTAWPFGTDAVVNTSVTPGTPTTTSTTSGVNTMCVPHTLQNSGNQDDHYNIVVGVPAKGYPIPNTNTAGGSATSGWTVGIYSDNACTTALGGASQSGTTSTASNVGIVVSGASTAYYIKYVAPASLPYFTRYDTVITATSVGDGTKNNTTHDELYASFIALTKTATIPSNGCPAGLTPSILANTVCPGGQITYGVDYRNFVLGVTDVAASFTQLSAQAGTFTITDDGTLASTSQTTIPNWAYFATMTAAPTDNNSSAVARATQPTFTYYTGKPASGGGSGSFATTDTKFQAVIGGGSFTLVPKNYPSVSLPTATQDWQGTLSFTIQAT